MKLLEEELKKMKEENKSPEDVKRTEKKDASVSMEIEILGQQQAKSKKVAFKTESCEHKFCINLSNRLEQLEEKVKNSLKDQGNKTVGKNINNPRLIDIENSIKGMNLRIDKLAWGIENSMEELTNLKVFEERIANIEGWRIATVHGLNSKVIPAVAKLQRQVQGIQKRVDAQNKFVGYNKHVYDIDGQQLNVRAECLDVSSKKRGM